MYLSMIHTVHVIFGPRGGTCIKWCLCARLAQQRSKVTHGLLTEKKVGKLVLYFDLSLI